MAANLAEPQYHKNTDAGAEVGLAPSLRDLLSFTAAHETADSGLKRPNGMWHNQEISTPTSTASFPQAQHNMLSRKDNQELGRQQQQQQHQEHQYTSWMPSSTLAHNTSAENGEN